MYADVIFRFSTLVGSKTVDDKTQLCFIEHNDRFFREVMIMYVHLSFQSILLQKPHQQIYYSNSQIIRRCSTLEDEQNIL